MSIYTKEKQTKRDIRNFTCKPCFRAANWFAFGSYRALMLIMDVL
jgi:hypothetical protein